MARVSGGVTGGPAKRCAVAAHKAKAQVAAGIQLAAERIKGRYRVILRAGRPRPNRRV